MTIAVGLHQHLDLNFEAEISLSMAQQLMSAFEGRTEEQTLVLESRSFGLWVRDKKTGLRMCIGSASPVVNPC